jgi:hypothetical protein
MNPTHGGKRPNSGRKPRATPKAQLSVRIEPHHAAKLRTHCKRRGISQAAWVTERIEENDKSPGAGEKGKADE